MYTKLQLHASLVLRSFLTALFDEYYLLVSKSVDSALCYQASFLVNYGPPLASKFLVLRCILPFMQKYWNFFRSLHNKKHLYNCIRQVVVCVFCITSKTLEKCLCCPYSKIVPNRFFLNLILGKWPILAFFTNDKTTKCSQIDKKYQEGKVTTTIVILKNLSYNVTFLGSWMSWSMYFSPFIVNSIIINSVYPWDGYQVLQRRLRYLQRNLH